MPGLARRTTYYGGVATFNDYAAQVNTVCGPKSGVSGTYGAAASDISPNISGGKCASSINYTECNGQSPIAGYEGPSCPTTNCGLCYKVVNEGGYEGYPISGVGNSVVVQIIDSCPAESAFNFCKTEVPADERCGSSTTNAMDIDQAAYLPLTGETFGSGPNLNISITPVYCP
ncbi:hypothetical protein MMC20_007439 [Loxospora ochrophaea]|nr:hypothetical protein [Loxospora ochrophaea]